MGRRLALVLLLLAPLAVPAAADARTKKMKVQMPADGDIAFARYIVRTSAPKGITVRNASRLGSSMIVTSARALSRRRHEVTVMMVNPEGGASAAQSNAFDIVFESFEHARIAITLFGIVTEMMREEPTASEVPAVNRFCTRKPPRRVTRRNRRSRRFFTARGGSAENRRRVTVLFTGAACQDDLSGSTLAAMDGLKGMGVNAPPCSGTARRDPASSREAMVELVCTEGANFITVRAQDGNVATNCAGPQDSLCRFGQQCGPAGPESSCHFAANDFPQRTPFTLRTAWQADPDISSVRARTPPQGAQMPTDFISLYLRHLDAP